ncbi:hypothetical protein ACFE04_015880 [Oxalis oulophora]
MSVQEYLEKHLLSRKIEEAVNAAVRAKTPDPLLFISNHMKKVVPSVITKIKARQILDSRGIPTVEVDLFTNKSMFRASVPSGHTTGMYDEAVELRDGDKGMYLGNSVTRAVNNINHKISQALIGMDVTLQSQIDQAMIDLDRTEKKSELGANAILPVSIAACKAGAAEKELPLYKYISELSGKTSPLTIPVPAFTLITGGNHAANNLPIQEIMILPIGATRFEEALQMGSETYQHLKASQAVITEKYGAQECNVGEDGGFAPNISSLKEGLDLVKEAISRTGFIDKIKIAIDVAASNFCIEYPIVSVEDPFDKEDWEHVKFLSALGICKQVVGDDLLMSNPKRVQRAIDESACSSLLLKTCVIEIKRASRDNNNKKKKKRDCRICHLGLVNNKNGLEEEEEYGGAPIHLGCSCKGDLAAAHKKCAETWFKIKGNMTCEICGATALNVGGEHIINEVNAAATTATSAALASQTPVIVVARESFWNGRRLMNFLLACGREFEPAMLSFTPSFSFGWLGVVNGVYVVVKDSSFLFTDLHYHHHHNHHDATTENPLIQSKPNFLFLQDSTPMLAPLRRGIRRNL